MSPKTLNIKEIMKKIPHRYPFILVDRITDYEERKWIKGIKNLTMNELFFQGHFPEEPIMPGVLMVEALAQTGGVLAMMETASEDKLAFFMTIDKVKFRRPAVPGDQLQLYVEAVQVRSSAVKMHGTVDVDGNTICEADFMFTIVDKKKV